jgi:uncharacterized protein (DUF302 family)
VKKVLFATIVVGGVVALVLTLVAAEGQPQEKPSSPRVDLISKRSFAETVKNLETALKKEGMMVVAKIDHQNMLKMVGVKTAGSLTIEFGKPEMGKMFFSIDPAVGLEMPARFYIYERADGKTVVSFYLPSDRLSLYGNPELKKMGMMMDMTVRKIAESATG